MQKLIEKLNKYTSISDEAKEEILKIVIKMKIEKEQILLHQDSVCRNLCFFDIAEF